MRLPLVALVLLVASSAARADSPPPNQLIDSFDNAASWQVVTADGVTLKTRAEPHKDGMTLRLDYDFTRGSGYGLIRKRFDLTLGPNYRFGYRIRGEGPRNTLEFKLVDPSGDNVWWVNQRDIEFPRAWTAVTLPRRRFAFAWGPSGGKPIDTAQWIEIAITSANGGKGTVWLDDLTFEPLPEARPYQGTPVLDTTSGQHKAQTLTGDGHVGWTSGRGHDTAALSVDFGTLREFGGLVLSWGKSRFTEFEVLGSIDGEHFTSLARVASPAATNFLQTPDAAARHVRIVCRALGPEGYAVLDRIRIMPPEFGDSKNAMLTVAAAESGPRGLFPRYFTGEAIYWTAVGARDDDKEALISEDGAVEVDKLGFSIEPFVLKGGKLLTWADSAATHSLDGGDLPIPTVRRRWSKAGLALSITAFSDDRPGESSLFIRYELTNTGDKPAEGSLALAVRPFQVTPPYQNLNITGGAADIRKIDGSSGYIHVDRRWVLPLVKPDALGATTWDSEEIATHLGAGTLPSTSQVEDPRALASAAARYDFSLAPGASRVFGVAVPFHALDARMVELISRGDGLAMLEERLAGTRASWRESVGRVRIDLPKGFERLGESIRANLAYILINRDGPAIQPGSRAYERTWIRDGALTSTALLSLGHSSAVREFLDWFAPYQYASGKIPCCVDKRGPDPVPENDSHGQYLYAVWTCFQFTNDDTLLRRHWKHVGKAVEYIESLRAQRMTDEFRSGPPEKRVLYGLLPESISHEGYSAKPMHSYWDDFWTLRGLSDAARIARRLGETDSAERFVALRDSFRQTLHESLRLAMEVKKIDYLPGCAELGDFDATSTTVALWPCAEMSRLPEPALSNTFERYWTFFRDRRDGRLSWDAYTPYEMRAIGSMVLLGKRDRAREMFGFFLRAQSPARGEGTGGWRAWPEVARRDTKQPGFIGDIPHTWVGSDFINSMVLMLAHTREGPGGEEDALIIGAGLPREWIEPRDGVRVEGLRTPFGALSFTASGERDDEDRARIAWRVESLKPDSGQPSPSAVLVSIPDVALVHEIVLGEAEAQPITPDASGLVALPRLPATLTVTYRAE